MTTNRPSPFWTFYDIALAFLAILASTDALIRFGIVGPAWLVVYALVLVRLGLVWRAAVDLMARNGAYFLYPAVCLASVLWSENQAVSLQASVQLIMTMLCAMFIGWRFSLGAICLLQFAGTFCGLGLSLLNWLTGAFGQLYAPLGGFLGVFTQKNMLGQRALFAILSAVAMLLVPRGLSLVMKAGLLAALAVTVFLLVLSKSVTAIVLVPVFLALLLALNAHRLPVALTLSAVTAGVLVLAAGPTLFALAGTDPVSLVLDAFGKSPSLTGRTDLWAMATNIVQTDPLLGVGFQAFWTSPAFANLAVLARDHGETVMSFHNFIAEVWVGTGVFGVVGILVLVGTSLWRTGLLWLRTRSTMAAYAFVGTVSAIILAYVGTGLYRQHEYTLMFIVMVGVAAQRELRLAGVSDRRLGGRDRPVPVRLSRFAAARQPESDPRI